MKAKPVVCDFCGKAKKGNDSILRGSGKTAICTACISAAKHSLQNQPNKLTPTDNCHFCNTDSETPAYQPRHAAICAACIDSKHTQVQEAS